MSSAPLLLLPVPRSGKPSTACDTAERSNIWAEGKLQEKKSALDKKLHDTVLKMNVNKLDILADLARLRKSASTGNLDRFEKGQSNGSSSNCKDELLAIPSSLSGRSSRSLRNSPILGRKGSTVKFHLSPSSIRKADKCQSPSSVKKSSPRQTPANIEIRVSKEWNSSSEEEDQSSPSTRTAQSPSSCRNKQRVSARYDNCNRTQEALVENVKRRYSKKLQPKST